MLSEKYLYSNEKDLGKNVGIISQSRIKRSLTSDKRKKYKELTLSYWVEKTNNIEKAFIYFRLSSKYSRYFVEELYIKSFKHFRFAEIQEELFKVRELSKCKNFSETSRQQNFYIFRGFTAEEAKLKVFENQSKLGKKGGKSVPHENRPQNIEYWTTRGFTTEEAKKKVYERQNTFSLDVCISKLGKEEGTKRFNERQVLWQEKMKPQQKEIEKTKKKIRIQNGHELPDELKDDFDYYRSLVQSATRKVRKNVKNIEKVVHVTKVKLEDAYSLDHRYSTKQGFIDGILPSIIGGIKNLEVIKASQNSSKNMKCSCSLEDII